MGELRWLATAGQTTLQQPSVVAQRVRQAYTTMRRSIAAAQMASIPVARIKETAKGLRIDALERAGYRTLNQVLAATPQRLIVIPNVGESTATKAIAAARQILTAAEAAAKVRIDLETRPAEQTALLDGLRRYVWAEDAAAAVSKGVETAVAILPVVDAAEPATHTKLRQLFRSRASKEEARTALDRVVAEAASYEAHELREQLIRAEEQQRMHRSPQDIWKDYEDNAAELLAFLEELTGAGLDDQASYGSLPAQIVERVRAQPLDLTLLTASLRGYQAFGAKFALAQRHTLLGDEMGLGKTVEAIAVMAHLRIEGYEQTLVVCPASVVANWRNEIRRHSKLDAHVIHGQERDHAYRRWSTRGGVGITTFDGLKRLPLPGPTPATSEMTRLPLLVVDEAHYAKNPTAGRSKAVAAWSRASDWVLFLSGTPMENRVSEFRSLVEMLQPKVAATLPTTAGVAGADVFRRAVAPAYLRRNQIDVLDELPKRLDSLDWIDPTADDLTAYRRAVGEGRFMAMRRAAYMAIPGNGASVPPAELARSAKLARFVDIVEEATQEGLKIVVFSYFRDVLERVTAAAQTVCPGGVYGPLTGSVPPEQRQLMVDGLTQHRGTAVLIAQIEAGGTGLNIQAASVVVLCEPQWKPSIESQAVARAHRMGQVRRVQVHRLLMPESVDQRMLSLLAGKAEAFDAYVAGSAIKDITPESIDVSDLEVVKRVASEAEAERQIIEAERRRLGFAAAARPTVESPGD
jgi:SNF2 family DNA or RNA helicase